MTEKWKDVPGYEGFYAASTLGRLMRTATPTGKPRRRIITPHKKKSGDSDYWLWLDGLCKRINAHRLVWETFEGPIPKSMCINHKNGIRSDNRLSNLEAVSWSDNCKHSYRVLKRRAPNNPNFGEKNGSARLTEADIPIIRQLYRDGMFQYEIAAKFGVTQRTICLITRQETWKHVK
jgi:hypothetical protein